MNEACASNDLLRTKLFGLMWVLTALLVAGQVVWPRANAWLAAVLLLMWGLFCSVNAARCGRLHCYVTGPLLLLAALAVVLVGLGVVHIPSMWLNIAVVGGVLLALLAELFFGKYVKRA